MKFPVALYLESGGQRVLQGAVVWSSFLSSAILPLTYHHALHLLSKVVLSLKKKKERNWKHKSLVWILPIAFVLCKAKIRSVACRITKTTRLHFLRPCMCMLFLAEERRCVTEFSCLNVASERICALLGNCPLAPWGKGKNCKKKMCRSLFILLSLVVLFCAIIKLCVC